MLLEKAENIRDVLKYVKSFNNKTIVIHIDDNVINSPLFLHHIKDISLIQQAGLQVVIVPGARETINNVLKSSNIEWKKHNGVRITNENAIPLIKMAAFDTANKVMTVLAGENKTAIIGNWVKARGKGIIDGIDYVHSGEIAYIDTKAIESVLVNNCIPIFPCIGWSQIGKPYNISSVSLASEIAIALHAEKLLYIGSDIVVTSSNFVLPKSFQPDETGKVWALTLEQANEFITENRKKLSISSFENDEMILQLIQNCAIACEKGVERSHIINGSINGAVLQELFSDIGQGTMVYNDHYAGIRPMKIADCLEVLEIMRPFIDKGILLERTEEVLQNTYTDYIVYEIDNAIKACCALHFYSENVGDSQAEIAGIVVDSNYSGIGIGPKMISYLLERAKNKNAKSIFILTTQTADWFESLGFEEDCIDTLPIKRKQLWDQKRKSKLFRLVL